MGSSALSVPKTARLTIRLDLCCPVQQGCWARLLRMWGRARHPLFRLTLRLANSIVIRMGARSMRYYEPSPSVQGAASGSAIGARPSPTICLQYSIGRGQSQAERCKHVDSFREGLIGAFQRPSSQDDESWGDGSERRQEGQNLNLPINRKATRRRWLPGNRYRSARK